MATFKRGKTWWTDFSVNGVRYRVSLDTRDWREAQSKEKEKIVQAEKGAIAPTSRGSFARLAFVLASERYLEQRKNEVSERTWRTEKDRVKPLKGFFGDKRLTGILADDVRAYQSSRIATKKHPRTVNHEVKLLRAILRRAKLPVLDTKLLSTPKPKKGRVLEPQQKLRLFQVASSKPEWQVAFCAALLTANCSLRPCEIRSLRWSDLNLTERTLFVPDSKTDAGVREVPLNEEAWSAVRAMLQRAEEAGHCAPANYVFFRLWPKVDPSEPMKSWRSAWRSLTRAIRCAKCGDLQKTGAVCRNAQCGADIREIKSPFAGLRYYNLRHQCVTEMLEAGVPEGVIREVVGHVDPDMLRWYSDVRRAARRAAVESISSIRSGSSGGLMTQSTAQAPHEEESLPANSLKLWRARGDLNARPLVPETSALSS
jgi:integrase